MQGLRRNLCQRFQYKTPLCQFRMRNRQARRHHPLIVEKQQVQIERARTLRFLAPAIAPIPPLHAEKKLEQRFRPKLGFELRRGIHKRRLIFNTHRLAPIQRRSRDDSPRCCKLRCYGAQRLFGSARRRGQIRAQPNECPMPHTETLPEIAAALCSEAMKHVSYPRIDWRGTIQDVLPARVALRSPKPVPSLWNML